MWMQGGCVGLSDGGHTPSRAATFRHGLRQHTQAMPGQLAAQLSAAAAAAGGEQGQARRTTLQKLRKSCSPKKAAAASRMRATSSGGPSGSACPPPAASPHAAAAAGAGLPPPPPAAAAAAVARCPCCLSPAGSRGNCPPCSVAGCGRYAIRYLYSRYCAENLHNTQRCAQPGGWQAHAAHRPLVTHSAGTALPPNL